MFVSCENIFTNIFDEVCDQRSDKFMVKTKALCMNIWHLTTTSEHNHVEIQYQSSLHGASLEILPKFSFLNFKMKWE